MNIKDFLIENYIWILVVILLCIITVIGFLADKKKTKKEKIKKEIENETPLGKIGKPIDIYRCAKWLIEDEFTTGQVISVNGGYVIN